jgi:hypothetical protein
MTRIVRRGLLAAAGMTTVLALTAGTASAHFCYFTDANVNAELGRSGSNGFVSFGDLAAEITGLCPAGVDVLADAAGVSTSTLINAHGLMAGGTVGRRTVKPISHLDFVAIDEVFPDAVAACI